VARKVQIRGSPEVWGRGVSALVPWLPWLRSGAVQSGPERTSIAWRAASRGNTSWSPGRQGYQQEQQQGYQQEQQQGYQQEQQQGRQQGHQQEQQQGQQQGYQQEQQQGRQQGCRGQAEPGGQPPGET